ncbi:hypothetical protein ACFQPF_12240 [Fictibacillus iocasae]|uniref:DUF2187 domain-containing protein n=1 Tax=Fictibacillus iocasae TaxID=2715437 RepID=A0ABW2NPN8_9BACL
MKQKLNINIQEGMNVKVYAGTHYSGEITEVEEHGFWLTENYQTEEYIPFIEVESYEELV